MNNIFIMQNEIENQLNKLSDEIKATDDEKIIALQLALSTYYKVKNTRNAYMAKFASKAEKENEDNGNSNA